jgi:DNA-binding MarR family transcriptional regulator
MSSNPPGRGELLAAIGDEMRKLVAEIVLFNQAVADRIGLNPTDLQCLNLLHEAGPLTAGRLAELSGLTTGAITGVVDRLERAGYARRAPDPGDRRRVIVEPLMEQAAREIGPLYAALARATGELSARYSDAELAAILDFITRAHPLNREETARLRAATPPKPPRRADRAGR